MSDHEMKYAADHSLAEIKINTPISIVIPTFKEAENIPYILSRLDQLRRDYDLELEVLFVDDNSADGSSEAVAESGFEWARIIVRHKDRGLSSAVIEGFEGAKYPVLVCMDCDLSHPPEQIPKMVMALSTGQQFVIGSRYVPGASTDDDWGILRWINSIIATILARPLTKVRDPMSGFFAIRKSDFDEAKSLNPVGYKIALELIVKCGFENIGEVPIHFSDRVHGESKLSFKQQLQYIQHLRRLYIHRFSNAMYLAQFLFVGASGVIVNLTVLSLLLMLNLPETACLAGGIIVSVITNFLLNRRFTFSYARDQQITRQFMGFMSASAVGALVSFSVSTGLRSELFEGTPYGLHLSALCGIAAGMTFNYLGNRYIVFRKRHIKQK